MLQAGSLDRGELRDRLCSTGCQVEEAGASAAYTQTNSTACTCCRLGVLIEVNCETDFVARGAKFKELVQDLAMQAAASPSAIVVALQDVPEAEIERERAIEMGKEDIQSKPEAIRSASVASCNHCAALM